MTGLVLQTVKNEILESIYKLYELIFSKADCSVCCALLSLFRCWSFAQSQLCSEQSQSINKYTGIQIYGKLTCKRNHTFFAWLFEHQQNLQLNFQHLFRI